MIINKNHWYDGLFYDKLIAPNQDKSYQIVKAIITANSSVLDAGCGTGRLAFQLIDKIKKYDGIDLSKRNIKVATKKLSKNYSNRISFHHADISSFLKSNKSIYDFAVVSYVIHEINENERENILLELSEYANKIIIVDYPCSRHNVLWWYLNNTIEFAAGKTHFKNFKTYIANKGIHGLAEKTGLIIIKEILNKPITTHIAVLSKRKNGE
ncbi:class I SAM-dependent methyltransferase [Melioribacteraceae bacterium 4301-Me]|uniref:class I SAM-dependent methyltransferase n=1 Tax=Pyranulibacter aquaticus TaxID=3163344 RepID=UPI003598D7A8